MAGLSIGALCRGSARLASCAARRRAWPLVAALATLVTGLAYSFGWGPVVLHKSGWVYPGDIWATFRGAHYVAWGALGAVYDSHSYLVSFPGILILLAPVSMLTSALGMSEAFPMSISHPSAWLVLGPVSLALAAVPLLALDTLAEERGIGPGTRRWLGVLEAAVLWIVVAYWGHPEDVLALGLAVYALASAHRGSWRACGWLLGAAVAVQPLTLLAAPAVVACAPARARGGVTCRAALPAAALLAVVLTADFPDTWSALARQPNYPSVNHPTPWVWLSPSLGHHMVAAGPGRMMAVAGATGIGAWVWWRTRRGRPVDVVLAVTLALAGRCLFEPVMVPFYLSPALALAVLMAAEKGRGRLFLAGGLALGLTLASNVHAGPLEWWMPMVVLLAAVVAAGAMPPRRPARAPRPAGIGSRCASDGPVTAPVPAST